MSKNQTRESLTAEIAGHLREAAHKIYPGSVTVDVSGGSLDLTTHGIDEYATLVATVIASNLNSGYQAFFDSVKVVEIRDYFLHLRFSED